MLTQLGCRVQKSILKTQPTGGVACLQHHIIENCPMNAGDLGLQNRTFKCLVHKKILKLS